MENIEIVVSKRNLQQEETWRYSGNVLSQNEHTIILEAYFNRPDTPFHGILLGQGDRFVETFYTDRWYNIFAMHDRTSDQIKGWYCNICYPAEINGGLISYVDLALDLLVYPDGNQLVLDQDEFDQLALPAHIQQQAWEALAELQEHFTGMFPKPN
jgi:uncharacterized protein